MIRPEEVFPVIARRFEERQEDILSFAASGYSFEEWLSWEAVSACGRVGGWTVRPKPGYKTVGVTGSALLGDLLVREADGSGAVLIEIGLIHSFTMSKWVAKLIRDTEKLESIADPEVIGLQIVVAASNRSPLDSPGWTRWLDKVPTWNRPTEMSLGPLPRDSRRLAVRGWRIESAQV